MATEAQKNKRIAAAQRKVNALQRKIDAATARREKAEAQIEAAQVPLKNAQRALAHAEATPVDGVFDDEVEQATAAAEQEAVEVQAAEREPEDAFI